MTFESFGSWRGNDYSRTYGDYRFKIFQARRRGCKTIAELEALHKREADGWANLGHW